MKFLKQAWVPVLALKWWVYAMWKYRNFRDFADEYAQMHGTLNSAPERWQLLRSLDYHYARALAWAER